MQEKELILIIDFYGQYNQLIARRVRECNVYSEIVPFNTSIEKIKEKNPKGIIFTGGPASVYAENAPKCTKEIFELGIPVLGICYGMQLMTHMLGGKVQRADKREYGVTSVNINNSSKLFKGFEEKNDCLMSHTDFVDILPEGFENIGATEHCPNAAMQNVEKNFYGIQFHPEVNHTNKGTKIISNFVYNICGCAGNWKMSSFAEETVKALKEKIGDKKALCALSGGVDSSVAAALINKAIGKNLTCIFVDHGLLRKNEAEEVEEDNGWGEKSSFEKHNKTFIRELVITGADPSTIDTDTYSQKEIDKALISIENSKKANEEFGNSSNNDSSWGSSSKSTEEDDELEGWD